MSAKTQPKQHDPWNQKNTLESLGDLGSSIAKNTASTFGDIGGGIFDQLFGGYQEENPQKKEQQQPEKKAHSPNLRKSEFVNLYNFQKEQEVRMIKELIDQIRQEIKMIKRSNAAMMSEVKDIEKIALEGTPDKPGIYHIRFLEIVLSMLRALRAKIGESSTWMQAMQSKKKKRGSAFAARSKKQGTQYSMSQELSNSRSVQ